MSHSRGLVDTLMHSVFWTAGRRFVNHLPLPLVMGFAGVVIVLYLVKKMRPKSSRARNQSSGPVTTRTIITKHVVGDEIITDKTVERL